MRFDLIAMWTSHIEVDKVAADSILAKNCC